MNKARKKLAERALENFRKHKDPSGFLVLEDFLLDEPLQCIPNRMFSTWMDIDRKEYEDFRKEYEAAKRKERK